MTTMTRTKPAQADAVITRSRGVQIKTIHMTCQCGVALTYCADVETFRRERAWKCYRCGEKYLLDA